MNRWHPLPAAVYRLVESSPATVLLESSKPCASPWTQIFIQPARICVAWNATELHQLLDEIESAAAQGLVAAGFFAYECGACFEPAAGLRTPQDGPLAWFGLYPRAYRFDHHTGIFPDGPPPGLDPLADAPPSAHSLVAHFALDEPCYAEKIAAIHEWIRSGDVYQLNFTAPFLVQAADRPAGLYAQLSARQPVEYGAFVHWEPGRHVLSFSPELFFRIDSAGSTRRITTQPMKGTAPRGRTTPEDLAQADWLRNDPKNRAENVMIVDLLRNDLGRLCRFGTVRVDDLFAVQRYPTLWQMTSTVTGELRPHTSLAHILRALFPCGSITGAPKVRAMQLIAQLEDAPRGIYTGAIGCFRGNEAIFNVAIRTLELHNGQGRMGAGSGVVIDSEPPAEYRECLLKAHFLTAPAQDPFQLIETMLWRDGFPRLALHLDRLMDSAAYFGFLCDPPAVLAALQKHANAFVPGQPRRVRLLLAADGTIHITDQPFTPAPAERIGRVCLAAKPTDSRDPHYFHKTTHRPLYAEAFRQATAAGFDDALFFNERGELTEGAISNVFLLRDNLWLTPPIACGLLNGVERRHLLATLPNTREQVLTLDDLRGAGAIYLCNALRGLRPVRLEEVRLEE